MSHLLRLVVFYLIEGRTFQPLRIKETRSLEHTLTLLQMTYCNDYVSYDMFRI